MKICSIGFDLPEGKVKYQDERVITLDQKLAPKKITPFYVEFTRDDFSHCRRLPGSPGAGLGPVDHGHGKTGGPPGPD